MKPFLACALLCAALPLFSQENEAPAPPAAEENAPAVSDGATTLAQNATPPAPGSQADRGDANGAVAATPSPTALGVKPGTEAIKEKDLYERTGTWHPFRRMPKFILTDQKRIWTSPFHSKKSDIKYWAIFGGATAALIATDKYVAHNAPDTPGLRTLGDSVSYLGEPYTLLPITAAFYFYGSAKKEEHFREAGLLSFETLADVTVVELALKSLTGRERPLTGSNDGHFFTSQSPRYNTSFPSGHAIETMALASIFAHEYHDKFWVKFVAYAYAGGVIGARLAANKHFPGDVMAGAAMGWFIGDYVYGKRHNPELDQKSVTQKILDHVRIGGSYDPLPPLVASR